MSSSIKQVTNSILSSIKKMKFRYMLMGACLILIILSVISRRGCVISRRGCGEGFEDVRRVDSYLPNYVVEVQRRCLPGEQDKGRYCAKDGCPSGMERGEGSGDKVCYPKCLDGYDSNGMSRCYKQCPPGFKQDKTTCANPGHKFKKDIVPCKGCAGTAGTAGPTLDIENEALAAYLPYLVEPPSATVIMTPTTESYPVTIVTHATQPHFHPIYSNLFPTTEYFENEAVPPTKKITINLREPRIDDPELPCPRGYTLSGDLCHENCPPHYRDTMDGNCEKKGYTIDRDSYDRGSGVPFVTKRLKYDNLFHT